MTSSPLVAQQDDTGIVAHALDAPPEIQRLRGQALVAAADQGYEFERWRTPEDIAADTARLDAALAGLQAQRPGVVDAYVISIALDSDPVFGREAREAGQVLGRRYAADGRTLTLAANDGSGDPPLPRGSISALTRSLQHIGNIMDTDEDVLILYSTSHGTPNGLYYHYGDHGYGFISPTRMAEIFDAADITNRLYIVSACFSGIFVEGMADETSVIASAASSRRTSFGCNPGNDWTYFGDAFVNGSLRQPQSFTQAFRRAVRRISDWEKQDSLTPSQPQISIGENASIWLDVLEARVPQTATEPVGRPARGGSR